MPGPTGSARKRQPQHPSSAHSQHLERRLLAYAMAGCGAIALAPPAGAEVVYTPADLTLTNGTLQIDLNHDGVPDFDIRNVETQSFYFSGGRLYAHGNGKSKPGLLAMEHFRAFAAPARFSIGPDSPQPFVNVRRLPGLEMGWGYWDYNYGRQFGGPWANVANKFLGLRFSINGEVHYGWARLSVGVRRSGYPTIRAHLTGYAYESEPNKAILAGDQGFGPEANLGPGDSENASLASAPTPVRQSLGLLSLGSLGLEVKKNAER